MKKATRHMQLTREWRLLRELQKAPDGRSYVELAKLLGSAVRTVYRDLETLRQAGFGITRGSVGGKSVWRLNGAGGPEAIAFTPRELMALTMARHMLLAAPGSPFSQAMQQAFHKIQAACDREGVKVLEIADRRLYADLRRARPYTSREMWFQMLLNALSRQRTVRIRYFTLERDTEGSRDVDPYGIVFHEGAFYVVAFCHWRREIRTFLLDRIRVVSETDRFFSSPAGFSVREHFRQAWGLIKGHALVTVRVRFAARVSRVIHEGRWHESQKLEDRPDGSVVMTVRVAGWEEIKRWVLGFGSAVEVLEPEELRQSVVGEAADITRVYGESRPVPSGARKRAGACRVAVRK